MKKVLLVVAAIALFAGSAYAGPQAFIGLYTDAAHSNCRQDVVAASVPFIVHIWVQPSDLGMICAEFSFLFPPTYYAIGTLANPDHSVALGAPPTGVSICFPTCQTDWTWLYQMTMLPLAAGIPDYMNIDIRPDAGAYQVANCEDGYPIESLIILNNLGLNQDCEMAVGTETSSWGAIKSIVAE